LEELKTGELVLKINNHKPVIQYAMFLSYGKNAAFQQHSSLSIILLNSDVIQIPTSFLMKLK